MQQEVAGMREFIGKEEGLTLFFFFFLGALAEFT